jgi:hypothetical protein
LVPSYVVLSAAALTRVLAGAVGAAARSTFAALKSRFSAFASVCITERSEASCGFLAHAAVERLRLILPSRVQEVHARTPVPFNCPPA